MLILTTTKLFRSYKVIRNAEYSPFVIFIAAPPLECLDAYKAVSALIFYSNTFYNCIWHNLAWWKSWKASEGVWRTKAFIRSLFWLRYLQQWHRWHNSTARGRRRKVKCHITMGACFLDILMFENVCYMLYVIGSV